MEKKSKRSPALIKTQEKYAKKLKESGRAKKSVTVWLTDDEIKKLDYDRENESRNFYIRMRIFGD